MLKLLFLTATSFLLFTPTSAVADYTCPSDSNVCSYVVNTGETAKVGAGGGGHTAHKAEWVSAPDNKYLVNIRTVNASQNGIRPQCHIERTEGQQTKLVQGVEIAYYKRALVLAHSETGSGMGSVGRTAHMHCKFEGRLADLPN